MYYFYVNFPNFNVDPIKIHRTNCGFCQSGNGMQGVGSNQSGFWAGPFNSYNDIVSALEEMNNKFIIPPGFANCSRCNPGEDD